MASIQDVAKRAQVGAATVSRVLSGKGYVSEKTREKVMDAVRELNYVPNGLGQQLLSRRSLSVGLIVPDLLNPFWGEFVTAVDDALRENGYRTVLCSTRGRQENELKFIQLLETSMVDGIITASHLVDKDRYTSVNRPIVSIDRILSPEIPMVCADHVSGGRAAADLLAAYGCRHVVQLRESASDLLGGVTELGVRNAKVEDFPFIQRHVEFDRRLEELGIRHDTFYSVWNTYDIDGPCRWAEHLFDRFPDVDGILATDEPALFCLQAAAKHGKRVPEDVHIVAYDGTSLTRMSNPPLDAIVQPVREMGQTAVEQLVALMNGGAAEKTNIVLPITVRRGTEEVSQ